MNETKTKMCIFMHCCNRTSILAPQFPKNPFAVQLSSSYEFFAHKFYFSSLPLQEAKTTPMSTPQLMLIRWGNVGAIHPSFKIHGKESEGEA